ncbi:hypothetical protein [Thioalkalivibrio sp. AKL8]|uniref:hypothetical protein n=1 Tax=Thioalkalivibrio sp. AKL8 TaxID=1158156 RepID=UPI00047621BF|nr:hypothetical protein [Thioalkalivibrio sp. AKL8]
MEPVTQPKIFSQELSAAALHLHRFFEAFQGGSAEPGDAPAFQATEELDRPGEFLQCLLDVVRVNFDPHAPGTLFLNSNIELINEGVRPEGFSLGYGSLVSGSGAGLESFWESEVVTYLGACGCDLTEAHALFVTITTGPERFQIGLADAASTALEETPGHDERQASNGGIESFGFCMDPALGDRLRVSVWAFSAAQA